MNKDNLQRGEASDSVYVFIPYHLLTHSLHFLLSEKIFVPNSIVLSHIYSLKDKVYPP